METSLVFWFCTNVSKFAIEENVINLVFYWGGSKLLIMSDCSDYRKDWAFVGTVTGVHGPVPSHNPVATKAI